MHPLPSLRELLGMPRLGLEPAMRMTFTFSLPTAPADAQGSSWLDRPRKIVSAPGQMAAQAGGGGQPTGCRPADAVLQADGFTVLVASDGEAGLALAREARPVAIVLDILLPRLDGWDVLARAKADPAIADIPVVVVSMLDERGKGFSLGAADYLVKPVQREALLGTLRRVIVPPRVGNGRGKVLPSMTTRWRSS